MNKGSSKFRWFSQGFFGGKWLVILVCVLIIAVMTATAAYLYYIMPDFTTLRDANPTSTAYARLKCPDYRLQGWTRLSDISPFLIQAVLDAEDSAFFVHGPVSPAALRKALRENLKHRRLIWGGSTITMQLARNLCLYPDRSVKRKILEMLLAHRLEKTISKQRILEIYLNVVEWGPCLFGITEASKYYFRKEPADLAPQEAAFLASILPNPVKGAGTPPGSQYNMRGAKLFRRLTRGLLPDPPKTDGSRTGPEHCQEKLDAQERRILDDIAVKLVSTFGSAIISGKARGIGLPEALAVLKADQAAFLENLLKRLYRTPEGRAFRRYKPEAQFAPLVSQARADHIPMSLRRPEHISAYDVFLLLWELRRQGYCLPGTWGATGNPSGPGGEPKGGGATGSGPASLSRPASSTDEILRWLRMNIAAYAGDLPAPVASDLVNSLEIPGIRADLFLMEVTAYCSCQKCCGWNRRWGLSCLPAVHSSGPEEGRPKPVGVATDGSAATLGTIAADTARYPLGTIMCVPGYGCGEVRDTGSAILGYRIDVFFPSHQAALEWGRRWLAVMVFRKNDARQDHPPVLTP